MKIKYIMILMIIAVSLSSCKKSDRLQEDSTTINQTSKNTQINKPENPQEAYNLALQMIESGNYNDAYEILNANQGDEKCKEIFDRFGIRYLEMREITNSGPSSKSTYEYNEAGKCIKIHYVTDFVNRTETYEYDESGNCVTKTIDTTSGEMDSTVITKYTYDANNCCVKEVAEGVNDSIANYTIEYLHDDRSRCIEKIYEYGENKEVTKYEYDSNDKCIREVFTSVFMGRNSSESTTEYTYDDNGNCIKKDKSFSDGRTETTEYVYDSYNKIQSSREKILFSEQNMDNEIVVTYKYDELGNLIGEHEEKTDITTFYSNIITTERTYTHEGRLLKKEVISNSMLDNGNEEKIYQYDQIQYYYQEDDKVIVY